MQCELCHSRFKQEQPEGGEWVVRKGLAYHVDCIVEDWEQRRISPALSGAEIAKQIREWADNIRPYQAYVSLVGESVAVEMRTFADRIEGEGVTTVVGEPHLLAEHLQNWMSKQRYGDEGLLHAPVCCDHVGVQRFVNQLADQICAFEGEPSSPRLTELVTSEEASKIYSQFTAKKLGCSGLCYECVPKDGFQKLCGALRTLCGLAKKEGK